jgi:hypothetical protein
MTDTTTQRLRALDELLGQLEEPMTDSDVALLRRDAQRDPDGSRIALVQKNTNTGERWVTVHANLEAAGSYAVSDEHPEDWELRFAVDLETRITYNGAFTITWAEGSAHLH